VSAVEKPDKVEIPDRRFTQPVEVPDNQRKNAEVTAIALQIRLKLAQRGIKIPEIMVCCGEGEGAW
jgi:hypothetical protein